MRTKTAIPIAFILGAGLVFSVVLSRLGEDIDSVELLRYLVIASIPMAWVLVFALTALRITRVRQTVAASMIFGLIMCVPMESFAYLACVWKEIGSVALDSMHIGILIGILIGWSVLLAILASIAAVIINVIRRSVSSP